MIVNNNSIFVNTRVANTKESTLGVLWLDNKPIGYVIEDEPREVKVKGETRIPAGIYRLDFRRQDTPMTLKYRKKFKWFQYHIELVNVPNFTGVYVHIGNTEKDTAGCQLICEDASTNNGEFEGKHSTVFFKEFYEAVGAALDAGKNVYYKIIDN